MSKANHRIPVSAMEDKLSHGIAIDRMVIKGSDIANEQQYGRAKESHRDQGHTFHIVERGSLVIEIDFQRYQVRAPSVIYMHPDQVHRILEFGDITVGSLSLKNEDLNPQYLVLLEDVVPARPLLLSVKTSAVVFKLFSMSMAFSLQKQGKLYHSLLRDSCNTLVAYLTSQLLAQHSESSGPSRFELVTRSFKKLLEEHYRTHKRPSGYADQLNISTAYLNECVKYATGLSVSETIQNKVIIEAKRLLYHSGWSVKEIANELGYSDHPYFSKRFSKATGMSALAFRNKNHD